MWVSGMPEKRDSVLTIDELSEYLKIPKSTLYKLVQDGKIPGQKVGRHWRFLKSRIDRWLEQSEGAKGRTPGLGHHADNGLKSWHMC